MRVDCAELDESLEGREERPLFWSIDEVYLAHVRYSNSFEGEYHASQVASEYLRDCCRLQSLICFLAVDTEALAWAKSSRTTRSLGGGALRDRSDLERIDTSRVLECPLLDEATVYYIFDSWNSHRCFCNIRAQNDFVLVAR